MSIKLKNATETIAFVEAFFKVINYEPMEKPFKECEVNGLRQPYDFCSTEPLNESIKFYDNAVYIGSGCRTWFDGKLVEWEKEQHWFVKRNKSA